jgi:hypothetical protein
MTNYAKRLKTIDDRLADRPLSFTIMTWLSMFMSDSKTSLSFYAASDYKSIFQGMEVYGTFWKRKAFYNTYYTTTCMSKCVDGKYNGSFHQSRPTGFIGSDLNSDYFSLSWDLCTNQDQYVEPCDGLFKLEELSFFNTYNVKEGVSLTFSFDIRSVIICQALNSGVLTTDDMTKSLAASSIDESYGLFGSFYVHPRYPSMTAIFCIEKGVVFNNVDDYYGPPIVSELEHKMCVLTDKGLFSLPLLRHAPRSSLYDRCNCSSQNKDETFCQLFTFDLNIISFLDGPPINYSYYDWQQFFRPSPLDYDKRLGSMIDSFQIASTELCPGANNSCALISLIMSKQGGGGGQTPLNGYNVQLGQLSRERNDEGFPIVNCKKSIYQESALQDMISTPPVPLVQNYKVCKRTAKSAAIGLFGSTKSTTDTVSGIFLSLIVLAIVSYYNSSKDDKQKIRSTSMKLESLIKKSDGSDELVDSNIGMTSDILERIKQFEAKLEDRITKLEAIVH